MKLRGSPFILTNVIVIILVKFFLACLGLLLLVGLLFADGDSEVTRVTVAIYVIRKYSLADDS